MRSIFVSCRITSRRESGCSQGGMTMFARRCFFSSRASHRGMFSRRGGRRFGVAPYNGISVSAARQQPRVQNKTRRKSTYRKQVNRVEPLSRYYRDELHFAQEGNFGGHEPRRQGQSHFSCRISAKKEDYKLWPWHRSRSEA